MISNFNEEAQNILIKAKLEMLELKHPYVGTEHLILSILHSDSELARNLKNYNLTYNVFKNEIIKIIGTGSKKSEFFLHTPLLKKVIENAIIDSKENNNGEITPNHLLISLLDVGEGIAIRIMMGLNIDLDKLYDDYSSKIYSHDKNNNKQLLVESIGENLTDKAKSNELDPVIGREQELAELEQILSRRTKNNPLLIGPPGVGKTALVEELARKIVNKEVSPKLQNKKIITLDMAGAVAGTKYRGEFEERMKKIVDELKKDENTIVFIDEIHTLVGAGGAEGAIDASNILKPALARGEILCIGATTTEEYKKSIEKDKALDRRFQTIKVEEPSLIKTKDILLKLKPIYEQYHNVIIDDSIIDKTIELSEKYIYNRYRPDKQIDILDEVCSKAVINSFLKNINYQNKLNIAIKKREESIKEKDLKSAYEFRKQENSFKNKLINDKLRITINDIAEVISNKTKMPVYEILKNNKTEIIKLNDKLKTDIKGQDKAINELTNIAKRIKLGFGNNSCTSILITGNHGNGKTLLATKFSELLLGKEIIKVNMSEYADSAAISKFTGSNPGYVGYDENNYLLNKIRDNPSSIIIFDEIGKAHQKILDLIIEMIETNKIKDSKNNTINLKNNIIILTLTTKNNSSIGFNNNISEYSYLKDEIPERLINCVNYLIRLDPLNDKTIKEIVSSKLENLLNKYNKYNIMYGDNLIDEIVNNSNYNEQGIHKIDRLIYNQLENKIIDDIIDDKQIINISSILS